MARLRRAVLGSAARRAQTDADIEIVSIACVLAASGKAPCTQAFKELMPRELGAAGGAEISDGRGIVETEALFCGMGRVAQSSEGEDAEVRY